MLDESGVRTVSRRGRPAPATRGCSCELLDELCHAPAVVNLFAELGTSLEALDSALDQLHGEVEGEPADWRLRLAQRGGSSGPGGEFEQLLAVVRCADTHAYRALERAGVDGHRLRKLLIDRVRGRGRELATSHAMPRTLPPRRGEAPPSREPATRTAAAPTASGGRAPVMRQSQARADPRGARQPEAARPIARPMPRSSEPAMERPAPALACIDPARLPPMHGRSAELSTLADALLRHVPRAPLLVADHGSGRTLLASHLATVLRQPLFRLEATRYADDEQLDADLASIADAGGFAIFDDLDRVAGDTAPPFLASLARAWATGKPRVLAISSHEGRARLAAWIPGILDTLDVIVLPPLDPAEVHAAVKLAAPAVLAHHGVELAPATHLAELARLADRHLGGQAMPGRALDLLDLSCARTLRLGEQVVDHSRWIEIVCERTGLPAAHVAGSGDQDMLELDRRLARQVVGHARVLDTLAQLIRRNRAGFASGRPIASVLLLGPSGVGKTEIAKALAGALFEREDGLLRLDMSEYAEAHAVARVLGAPPGYVGHEHGGALTDPMLRQPHRVVLLDEIEKAHRDVHQLLLQVFDEGRLTDGRGRTVDFRHSLVLMTSNLGAELLDDTGRDRAVGDDEILALARAAFPIELWNRIEAPLVLRPLARADMLTICHRLAHQSSERLFRDRGIRYSLDDTACEWLVDRAGEDPALGARPLRHLLSREIEGRVSEAVLRGRARAGQSIEIDARVGHRLELTIRG